MKQPIYGITAASGHLGRLSAQELLLRGVPASDVVAVVRSRSKAADEHQKTEQTLREADVPFTLLRNGWYSENYTDQLGHYLENGEIVGAAG